MVGERDEADGIDPEDAILGSGENNDTESKLEGELFPKESICESISSLFGKSLSEISLLEDSLNRISLPVGFSFTEV